MELSRRRVLSILSAAGLAAVVHPPRAAADLAADVADVAGTPGTDRMLANTVTIFAGTPEVNTHPAVAAKLAAIDRTAATWRTALQNAGDGELFAGLPLGTSDPNLNASYQHLYEIALATATPGCALHGDTTARQQVHDGLVWLHDHYYGDQSAGYYGNWFTWEIGISTHAGKTLALLAAADAAPADLVATYVASMDAYLRNGIDGDVNLDSRFHTGANLADITTNRMIQGALLGDEARIRKAIEDQLTVFATIDPYALRHGNTDGYYADGSFIQHHSVAYTGAYGRALLTRVVQTLKILDGTGFADGAALAPVVQRWVTDGFAPLIFEGWMMEIVKGRSVSRTSTGYTDVAQVVEAVVDLADHADDPAPLRGYVKFIRSTSRAALDPVTFVSPISIARYADLIADDTVAPADLNPPARCVAFNAMDKTVHRRPGYAFALARSSDRISKYEYMSGENLMPWFQGDGAHYLYLSGQDQTQAFGVDYFTTVSPYGLAGVTAPVEERRTIPQLYGTPYYDNPGHPLNFTSSSQSQNTYVYFPRGTNAHSGGATLDAYGTAALVQSSDVAWAAKQEGILPEDFVVYRNATATKSWFLFDDEIVVLAAGVGDEAGRAVTTTVDARIAAATDPVTATGALRSGGAWTGPGTADLAWLRYANPAQDAAVGYVFLSAQPVRIALDTVTRSRRVVRTANPDTAVTKRVLGVTIDHPAGAAPAALAYAVVPHATEAVLTAYAEGPLEVLANTTDVQAVRHTGLRLTGVNTFTPGRHHAGVLTVDGPASVLARTRAGRLTTVAVSDPTMNRDVVEVLVRGRTLTRVAGDRAVTVSPATGGTLLRVDTRHAYGRSFSVTLRG
ncbi:polysaccharide lyase family 8 super-sandwich domain-containing protein [Jiangella rhizosphaerae]|uniref:Silent information regulator protein Sir2 n=1 Tax=Jiangella rhizosphaerae TaxID=2293569 RepID=A0A418KG38_9ACTN|nr:polysaccharide lyase family 8 super-sandwich domain-containing protein [Jiangella rhizosphaerae]RIQ10911.1 silent information regulator protein Sir2 [Jiangella rhizosphaerae]